MKNNTKIRLHLSKQLFESLTKQVIAEAKTKHYGAGMEEVKAKKEKAPKKERMEEMEDMTAEALNVSKNDTPNLVYSRSELKKKLLQIAKQMDMMKGLGSAETAALAKLIDDLMAKLQQPDNLAPQVNMAAKAFGNATKKVSTAAPAKDKSVKEMETMTAEGDIEEAVNPMHYITDPSLIMLTKLFGYLLFSGMGLAVVVGIAKDLLKAKKKNKGNPEAAKQEMADVISQAEGGEEALQDSKVQQELGVIAKK